MRPAPLVLTVALSGALMACAERDAPNGNGGGEPVAPASAGDAVLRVKPLAALPMAGGSHAIPHVHSGQTYWFATAAGRGMLLADAQGQILGELAGGFERLAVQAEVELGDKSVTLVAGVDIDSGDVVLAQVDWSGPTLQALARLKSPAAEVEALCWYPTGEGHLSLFLGDARGQLEQRLIVDGNRRQLVERSIREFTGAPEMSACVVDIAKRRLYVAEEKVGIWAYPAEGESSSERELIVTVAPIGPIDSEIEGLALVPDGSLLVSAPEMGAIWQVESTAGGTARQLSTGSAAAPEAIGLAVVDGNLLLAIYDDESGRYWQTEHHLSATTSTSDPVVDDYPIVAAVAETTAVRRYGDAADDPAIWINSREPAQSRVLGTDKKQGLMIYDLQGAKLQELGAGRLNNVDLRYGFELDGRRIDLAAASNRSTKAISLFAIAPDSGQVKRLEDIATNLDDPYGLCMGHVDSQYFVYINDSDGRIQQYRLEAQQGRVAGQLVREFRLESQPEGCVVDDANAMLYLGEEARGIWRVAAGPADNKPQLIAEVGAGLRADVEGMAIYPYEGKNYLVVSSQGDNSYSVFALDAQDRYLGSFRIGPSLDLTIDGTAETDGLAATATALGPQFPNGLLVAQDGYNLMPQEPQNFKLVPGTALRDFISSRLQSAP